MNWNIILIACLALAVDAATYHGAKTRGSVEMKQGDTVVFKSPRRFPIGKDRRFNVTCIDYANTPIVDCRMNIRYTVNCEKDYLSLSDGSSMIDERYCGWSRVNQLPSGTGHVELHFHSRRRWGKRRVRRFYRCNIKCELLDDLTTASSTATTTTTSTTTASTESTSTTTVATTSTPQVYTKCECGIPNRTNRIIGGTETEKNEYPWQCGIVPSQSTKPYCGCSIINNEYLITAAHCFSPGETSVNVILGDHDWTLFEMPEAVRRTATVTVHPNYNDDTYNNDIAVLKLDQPIDLDQTNLHPVCLPTESDAFYDETGKVTGWGNTQSGVSSQSNVLLEVDVPIWSREDCDSYPGVTENMICAGFDQGGKDSCQGDSGGPLTVEQSGHYILAGIVSWGRGCAEAGNPGVYTNVPKYLDWINTQTSGGKTCENGYTVAATKAATTDTSASATTTTTTTTTAAAEVTTPTTVTVPTTAIQGFDCTCGSPSVGGSGNSIEQNPWAVALRKSSGTFCSGVLINTYYVLTSKECADAFDLNNDELVVNAPNAAQDPPGPISRIVLQKINNGDVSLLQLGVALSPIARAGVKNLCLPQTKLSTGSSLWSSGYSGDSLKQISGSLSNTNSGNNRMLYTQSGSVNSSQGRGGAVFGDATLNGKTVKTLVGIALESGKSGIEVADVSQYLSFIVSNTASGRFCNEWIV